MPIKQNAKKALRQARKRTLINKQVAESFKKAVKTAKKAVASGDNAAEAIRLAQQQLDKAAKKGVIKKNTASRRLSRLMKLATKKK